MGCCYGWTTMIDCKGCEAFPKCVERFECDSLAWPLFLEYVQKTWIEHLIVPIS